MGRDGSHGAEVVRRADDPLAEHRLPEAVDPDALDERGTREPISARAGEAPAPLAVDRVRPGVRREERRGAARGAGARRGAVAAPVEHDLVAALEVQRGRREARGELAALHEGGERQPPPRRARSRAAYAAPEPGGSRTRRPRGAPRAPRPRGRGPRRRRVRAAPRRRAAAATNAARAVAHRLLSSSNLPPSERRRRGAALELDRASRSRSDRPARAQLEVRARTSPL